ncbi:MAG TPA: hypothetical protein PKZ32_06780 [Candidatus Melainabacteria bacterium]|nr:hypothetical protein [Candidatus Melainabacteria bacterium]
MIEPGRTNIVPRTLIALCLVLFCMRAFAIFYGTYSHKSTEKLITWQKPAPIDNSRRDLLSKPTLYFFYENDNQIQKVTAQVFESMLFHNREVGHLVTSEFVPVKVPVTSNNVEPAKSLSTKLSVYSYPSILITLPNGKRVHRTSWQSDRMFQAFLKDAMANASSKAALEAMQRADWPLACEAYSKAFSFRPHTAFFSKFDSINWAIALRHQHEEAKAKEVLEAAAKKRGLPDFITGKTAWPQPCVDYLLGKISAEELAKKDPEDKHDYKVPLVRWVIGEKLLLDGKREAAISELKQSAATKEPYVPAAKYARAQLRQLGEKVADESEEEADYYY